MILSLPNCCLILQEFSLVEFLPTQEKRRQTGGNQFTVSSPPLMMTDGGIRPTSLFHSMVMGWGPVAEQRILTKSPGRTTWRAGSRLMCGGTAGEKWRSWMSEVMIWKEHMRVEEMYRGWVTRDLEDEVLEWRDRESSFLVTNTSFQWQQWKCDSKIVIATYDLFHIEVKLVGTWFQTTQHYPTSKGKRLHGFQFWYPSVKMLSRTSARQAQPPTVVPDHSSFFPVSSLSITSPGGDLIYRPSECKASVLPLY